MRHTPRAYALGMFALEQRFFSPVERVLYKLKVLRLQRRRESEFQLQPGHVVAFNPAVLELPDNTYLDGFFPSPRYFSEIQDVLRQDFSFREPLAKECLGMAEQIAANNSVCVHVRRGDYVANVETSRTVGVCPLSYYRDAVDVLRGRGVRDPHFFVFSDDVSWCRENLSFDAPVTFVGEEYAGKGGAQHFRLMTACRHFIIPNSSFSWWPAWLSVAAPDKVVIAPKVWSRVDIGANLVPDSWATVETDLVGG